MCSVEPDGDAASGQLVAGIAALAAQLATQPAPESGAACYDQAEALGQAVDLLESAIAARVAVATRMGQVAEWGHTSPTAWLRTSLGMRHGRAEERAVLAEQLPRLPRVAERLTAGELSAGYAAAIAGGVRRLDAADCGKAEHLLLNFVDEGHSVGQIARFADKIKDLIAERDDTAAEPEDGRRAERQWWSLHRSGTGAFVKGHFGPELMTLVKTKLEPLARPCGAEDTRDHAERLADALQTYLSGGESRWDPILVINLKQQSRKEPARKQAARKQAASTEPGVREPGGPEHAVTEHAVPERIVPEQVVTPGARQVAPAVPTPGLRHGGRGRIAPAGMPTGPGPGPGPGRGWVLGPPDLPPGLGWPFDGTPFTARLADGTAIPSDRARAILLNAGFSALVLGTDGHPLYLGRRVRFASLAQRRVLHTRYATCVTDGCEIPAISCQVDHIDGWENGQGSDIDQLVPCCSFHNRYKWRHPDRVIIHRLADGRYRYQIIRPGNHQDRRPARRTNRKPSGPDP